MKKLTSSIIRTPGSSKMETSFQVPRFEDLSVTTMTLIFELIGEVNLPLAFTILPITRLDIEEPKRQTKNFKLPDVRLPGHILSARYDGDTRGIVRSVGSHFKNCITLDIGTSDRIVSIKLSRQKIQMCGPKSVEIGQEAAAYVVAHINYLQSILTYMAVNAEATKSVLSWLISKSVGPLADRQYCQYLNAKNLRLKVYTTVQEPTVSKPTEIPIQLDQTIAAFLLPQCDEYMYHSDLVATLQGIATSRYIVMGGATLSMGQPQKAMVNYNYNLGFSVNRAELANLAATVEGFIADYDNLLQHSVRIYLPYTDDNGRGKRRNHVKRHTFMISRSGSVTQSGPNDGLMRLAYYRFMELIQSAYPYIRVDDETKP